MSTYTLVYQNSEIVNRISRMSSIQLNKSMDNRGLLIEVFKQ